MCGPAKPEGAPDMRYRFVGIADAGRLQIVITYTAWPCA
jgi:hypothetical protein